MKFRVMVLTFLVGSLAACAAVGPDFARPKMSLGKNFLLAPEAVLRQAADDQWWKAVNDPALNELMRRALVQSLDVQAARARILESRALLRAAGPAANLSGDLTVRADATKTGGTYSDSASAGFAPSFLIDLFGERRRRGEQAAAALEASIYDEAAVRLALQLEVAVTYFDLRFFQKSESLRRRSIANRSRLVQTVRARHQVQNVTQYELSRAEAELQLERARLPSTQIGIDTNAFALATLLSEPADRILKQIARVPKGQPAPMSGYGVGVPASLLQNRPDIRAAEARLAAAVAEIGIQEAQLYPSLRIGGTINASSTTTTTLGAALSVPVFDRAVRQARRDASKARALQAEIAWRQTVLGSVEEVQVNLVQISNIDNQVRSLNRAASSYRKALRLSREAFDLNAITLNEIIDSENTLTSTELQLADARRVYAASWARLNVAIGQGWHATP